jgi:hypothetical protein
LARQLIADLPFTELLLAARESDELRKMGRQAIKEHAAGRTKEFSA